VAKIALTINGKQVTGEVAPNTLLVEFLRQTLSLTGTHVGCDTSQCGACVVHLNGNPVKSCTTLAVQANGGAVTTIEGLSSGADLHPVQAAFREAHALQCGFCTPGMVMTVVDMLKKNPKPAEHEIRAGLSGNICRCTGYHNIVKAVQIASGQVSA
jgi:aerobic carbon-monoxide dehydrogenase small subunit